MRTREMRTAICPVCEVAFATNHKGQICCSEKHASRRRRRLKAGLPIADASQWKPSERVCPVCGDTFMPKSKKGECCSYKCISRASQRRKKGHPVSDGCVVCGGDTDSPSRKCDACYAAERKAKLECSQCGKILDRETLWKRGNTKHGESFCGKSCAGKWFSGEGRHWNYSGGSITPHGYRVVKHGGKQMMEHRLVMEQHIGRSLTAEETVHHKDGNRLNNDISNLELWTGNHSYGVRQSDLLDARSSAFVRANPRWITCYAIGNDVDSFDAIHVDTGVKLTFKIGETI